MAGPRRGPGRIPEKPKNFKGTITKLFRCLGRYRLPLVLVLVLALASTAFGIVGPKILSTATTELATGLGRKLSGLGGIDFGKIGKILLTVLALYLVSAACSFFQSWILAGITQKLAYRLRGDDGQVWSMVQIAGLVARRIVCRTEPGDPLARGQRYGMIRFGSRVDLYLPRGYVAAVRIGEQVFAGQSVIARVH